MSNHLHIDQELIPKLCLELYKEHGTTMAGLKVMIVTTLSHHIPEKEKKKKKIWDEPPPPPPPDFPGSGV